MTRDEIEDILESRDKELMTNISSLINEKKSPISSDQLKFWIPVIVNIAIMVWFFSGKLGRIEDTITKKTEKNMTMKIAHYVQLNFIQIEKWAESEGKTINLHDVYSMSNPLINSPTRNHNNNNTSNLKMNDQGYIREERYFL